MAVSPYLIEAVLGQLNTTLISPKNLPSPMVSNTIGSSCSDTTSTVPRWIKYIWKGRNLLTGTPKTCCFNFKSFCQNFISFYINVNQETLCFSFFTIIANIVVKKNSLKRSVKELLLKYERGVGILLSLTEQNNCFICVQKFGNHSRNSLKLKFYYKMVNFLLLDMTSKPRFCSKIFRGCQSHKKLLQTPEVAQKLQSTIGAIRERRETVEEREKNPKE